MNAGDLIRFKDGRTGIIIQTLDKKVFETSANSKVVDWDKASLEPHVEIMFSGSSCTFIQIPVRMLELDTKEVIPCKKEIW